MLSVFITDVWTPMIEFIVGLFAQVAEIFVVVEAGAVTGLTLIGTLFVLSAGISMLLLVFNLIRSFVGRSEA